MRVLWLFDTCGYVVGPAIVVAGLVAVALCLRASRASAGRRQRWQALAAAAAPVAVGLGGAVFGLVAWWAAGAPGDPWEALGKVCLAGAVVAVVPLVWAALLLGGGRNVAGPAPAGGAA